MKYQMILFWNVFCIKSGLIKLTVTSYILWPHKWGHISMLALFWLEQNLLINNLQYIKTTNLQKEIHCTTSLF